MRQLLFVALLLLCISYGVVADGGQKVPGPGDSLWLTYVPYVSKAEGHHHHGQHWKPIRIAVGMQTAMEEIHACRYFSGKGEDRNRFPGMYPTIDKTVCEKIGDLDHHHILNFFNKIVPEAVKLHADRLLVKPVEGPLKVPGNKAKFPRTACRSVQIGGYDEDFGIHGADVAIYVGLASTDGPVAHVCKTNAEGRPIAARVRLTAQDIIKSDASMIRTFAHHIAHGIGFDEVLHKHEVMSSPEAGRDGIVTYEYNDASLMHKIQRHLRCDGNISAIKMEASMEGAPRLHFSKGVKGELMSPLHSRHGSNKMVYSALSLAVFESTGHFKAVFKESEEPEDWIVKQKEVCEVSDK